MPAHTLRRRLAVLTWFVLMLPLPVLGQGRPLTLDRIFKDWAFYERRVQGPASMRDGEHYTASQGGRIVRYRFQDGREDSILLSAEDLPHDLRQYAGYQLSPDEQRVLLTYDREPIYRRSMRAQYRIFDLRTRTLTPLSDGGKQRLATFSPNSRDVAFVRENNLFIAGGGQEQQITTDGRANHVINGAADWVYEEEFAMTTALWWSPDGRYLAYLRFDESRVKDYHLTWYGEAGQDEWLYPRHSQFKYPKAGEENSRVTLHVYDTSNGHTQQVDVGPEPDQYLPRVFWAPGGALYFIRMNRLQNHLELLLADPTRGTSRVVFEEREPQYIEEPTDWYITFLPDGKRFVVPSERDGRRHLYLHSIDGGTPVQLTHGPDEICQVYGYSPSQRLIYYQGYDGGPLRKAVYAVSLDGKKRTKLSPQPGVNSAWFNRTFTYFIHTHSDLHNPRYITLHRAKGGQEIRVLEDNQKLRDLLKTYQLPSKRFITFTTPEGTALNGCMVLPPSFDSTRRYPVLMEQYSGPNSQQVLDRWSLDWADYLATQGVIVVVVDPRGTGGRGEDFRKCTYGELGRYESDDLLATVRYLAGLPYVDGERIGIWGWSYGGTMSSLCLMRSDGILRMAIAVAPVTNWRYYDTIYTERFMGLPQTNGSGYDAYSPITHAAHLKGRFLLVHGSADDNVHDQHSMLLVNRLIRENIPFDMAIYPDRNHNINSKGSYLHLYERMTRYVQENLL